MKYLYTALILVFMSQGGATAQEKKSGFFDKVKTTFSSASGTVCIINLYKFVFVGIPDDDFLGEAA